jgi:hypothetical protein
MEKLTAQEIKRKFNQEKYSRVHADLPKEMVTEFKSTVKAQGEP